MIFKNINEIEGVTEKNYFKEKPILVFKSRKIKASGYPPNSTPMLQQNGLNTECLHPLMEQLH